MINSLEAHVKAYPYQNEGMSNGDFYEQITKNNIQRVDSFSDSHEGQVASFIQLEDNMDADSLDQFY